MTPQAWRRQDTYTPTLNKCTILKRHTNNDYCIHPQLEKELTYENFVEWTRPDMVGQSQVEVTLPRFKMEEKYDLNDVLVSMGMKDAFDVSMSDFSGETYAINVCAA